ncbi:hypothetical protein NA56DRAFT_653739 [Hyaloscypha hepaticicola]|uniref:Uncharacterized protein n=1 Tax=Hyaloscypha hepaticicola TaxID=2082293 RepID=A0A2J6QNX1_9HELO|nr:hypothetical protein NA56DRAFT_653739 [Hyaloscypha hepaticicola]
MAVTQRTSHPISSPESDIAVCMPQWPLVWERASQAAIELLLLACYVVLVVVRFLRSVVGDVDPPRSMSNSTLFDLLRPDQEDLEAPTSPEAPEDFLPYAFQSFLRPLIDVFCSAGRVQLLTVPPRVAKPEDIPPFESLFAI